VPGGEKQFLILFFRFVSAARARGIVAGRAKKVQRVALIAAAVEKCSTSELK